MNRAGKFRCRISATKLTSLIPQPTTMKTIYMKKRLPKDLLPPKKTPTVWITPILILTNKSSFLRFQTTSTKSPPPTAAHGCCLPKSIPAAAFSNWSPNSTATAAISASATTTTDCRTAFTTAAADTSNPYSPPSVCTTTIPTSTRPESGTSSFPKTSVSTSTALPPSPSTARNWCATTTTAAAI